MICGCGYHKDDEIRFTSHNIHRSSVDDFHTYHKKRPEVQTKSPKTDKNKLPVEIPLVSITQKHLLLEVCPNTVTLLNLGHLFSSDTRDGRRIRRKINGVDHLHQTTKR